MTPWTRSTWTDAGQVLAQIDPDEVAGEAVGQPLHAWHARLLGDDDLAGAISFMAHAMSRYDCIAWAAQSAIATQLIERSDPLFVTVLQWLDQPEDDLRRAAVAAAEGVRADSPAKLLCLAVQFSGGSLAPEDMAPVLPPPGVCAQFVAASLLSGACSRPDPDAVMREVLKLGEAMVAAN